MITFMSVQSWNRSKVTKKDGCWYWNNPPPPTLLWSTCESLFARDCTNLENTTRLCIIITSIKIHYYIKKREKSDHQLKKMHLCNFKLGCKQCIEICDLIIARNSVVNSSENTDTDPLVSPCKRARCPSLSVNNRLSSESSGYISGWYSLSLRSDSLPSGDLNHHYISRACFECELWFVMTIRTI